MWHLMPYQLIRTVSVRNQPRILNVDVSYHDRREGCRRRVRDVHRPHATATLYHPEHYCLILARVPLAALLLPAVKSLRFHLNLHAFPLRYWMTTPRLATNIGFVSLNDAGQRPVGFTHGLTDTVSHEPRRAVMQAKHTVKLVGADALLGSAHEIYPGQPFRQGDMAILEDRSDCRRKLLAARAALVKGLDAVLGVSLAGDLVRLIRTALRADSAIGPALPLQEVAALVVCPLHYLVE